MTLNKQLKRKPLVIHTLRGSPRIRPRRPQQSAGGLEKGPPPPASGGAVADGGGGFWIFLLRPKEWGSRSWPPRGTGRGRVGRTRTPADDKATLGVLRQPPRRVVGASCGPPKWGSSIYLQSGTRWHVYCELCILKSRRRILSCPLANLYTPPLLPVPCE